jgi:transcriptional regulator with GAF, ATPase, and Fis domain
VTLDQSPAGLASLYADIGRQLDAHRKTADAFAAVAHTALARVPAADWTSITRGRHGSFETVAATDPTAVEVDSIQYELGSGPCVDAVLQDTVFRTGDLRADPRWPKFGHLAADAGVHSMLSFRLFLDEDDLIAGLNFYSTRKDAFDEDAQTIGTLLATHGALAISAAAAREQAAQLQQALITSRNIGMAMGVLMAQHKISRNEAFDLLRMASQHANRKLADIALDVADTGTLDLPGNTRPSHRRRPKPTPQRQPSP